MEVSKGTVFAHKLLAPSIRECLDSVPVSWVGLGGAGHDRLHQPEEAKSIGLDTKVFVPPNSRIMQ